MSKKKAAEADHAIYTTLQIDTVQGLIEDSTLAPYVKLQRIIKHCKQEGITQTVENVTADMMLVHPDNRGSLLLDFYKMHQNGSNIKKAGANTARLQESVCFGVSTNIAKRSLQFDANRKMVANSGGHVAPVAGHERYISVGTSHFSQFCKGALAGVKTPIAALQDANGCLQKSTLEKNDEFFSSLLNDGWSWLVFPPESDETWPELANTLQFALNAGNNLYTPKSEMECFMDICSMASSIGAKTLEEYKEIAAKVGMAMPECHGYLVKIAELARMFPHGDTTPKELHEFANQYGESRKLGEEFITAVTDAAFFGGRPHPNLRKACLATNLISSKVVDGISRLLVKSDVAKVTKLKECEATEKSIADLEDSLAHLLKLKKLSPQTVGNIKFRFMTRLITNICGKGKQSFDARDFTSIAEIQHECLTELTDALGGKSKEPEKLKEKWNLEELEDESSDDESNESLCISDPKRIAFEHGGFKIGSMVTEKKGDPKIVFEVKDIQKEGEVKLVQHTLTKEQLSMHVTVTVDALVEQWRVVKGGIKQFSIGKDITRHWGASSCFAHAHTQAKVFAMLSEAEIQAEVKYKNKLMFCVAPRELRTIDEVAKGQLKFNPFTELSKMVPWTSSDGERTKIMLTGRDPIKVSPPEYPSANNPDDWSKTKVGLIPFWWVTPCAHQDQANMSLVECKTKDAKYFYLTNDLPIPAFTPLCVYFQGPKPQPLQNAKVETQEAKKRPAVKTTTPPSKKGKTNKGH